MNATAATRIDARPSVCENRLSPVSFAYDPFGRRIEKTTASGSTVYLYDGANVVEELNASGAVTASYAQGLGIDEPLVEEQRSGRQREMDQNMRRRVFGDQASAVKTDQQDELFRRWPGGENEISNL